MGQIQFWLLPVSLPVTSRQIHLLCAGAGKDCVQCTVIHKDKRGELGTITEIVSGAIAAITFNIHYISILAICTIVLCTARGFVLRTKDAQDPIRT